jgi:hypothetical protein
MTAGRPPGRVRLMDDPGRFEVAAWLAFTETGLGPYPAAYLVTFLLASDAPIVTESIEGVLLQSSAELSVMVTPKGHADWLRRKAPEAIARADDNERDWLARSASLIAALIEFVPRLPEATLAVELTLGQLKIEGWTAPILYVTRRIGASLLRSNFPPAEGPLSRTAKRRLRELLEKK